MPWMRSYGGPCSEAALASLFFCCFYFYVYLLLVLFNVSPSSLYFFPSMGLHLSAPLYMMILFPSTEMSGRTRTSQPVAITPPPKSASSTTTWSVFNYAPACQTASPSSTGTASHGDLDTSTPPPWYPDPRIETPTARLSRRSQSPRLSCDAWPMSHHSMPPVARTHTSLSDAVSCSWMEPT